jgi:S1-C subfamily serine protease
MVVVTQRRRAQIAGPERVLTSYHVVEGASKIKVTVAETSKTYQATVVGSDQTADEYCCR